MGYTHYFRRQKELDRQKFQKLVDDVRKLIKASAKVEPRVLLADGRGTVGSVPQVNLEAIVFNGMDYSEQGGQDGSHETVYIPRVEYVEATPKELIFNFCKTARKDYDLVVVATLIAFKKHFPEIKVTSDGNQEDWEAGIAFCQEILGYGASFNIEATDDGGDFEENVKEVDGKITREYVIKFLTDKKVDSICEEIRQGDIESLTTIIRDGIDAISEQSNVVLENDFYMATSQDIQIEE